MANLRYTALRAGLDAIFFSGAQLALRGMFGGVGAVLTMHHVRPPRRGAFQPNRILEIEAEFLERVIVHLRERRIDIVSLGEVRRRLRDQDFKRRFVCLTFDDGYRDNLEYAWPVLKRHEVPFAIYVATSFPDRLGELWWVAMERVIASSDRFVMEMNGKPRFFHCSGAASKRSAFTEVYWWLRSLSDEEQIRQIVRDFCNRYGIDIRAPCRELCMNWSEIASLAREPICTIGAHTVNHVFLRKVSAEIARAEMRRGAEVLEAALGRRPEHFAYPYGDASAADAREFDLAREIGFRTAVTTRPGVIFPEHRDHLTALPRISLNGEFQALRYVDALISGVPFGWKRRPKARAA